MPFDSFGNFSRVHRWQEDRDNGVRILADRHDEEDDNFGEGFNLTFLRTGTVPMTGNLQMGGNSIKTIKAGTEASPGLSFELSNQTGIWQPNPTTLAVSSNGVKKFEVNGAGASVFGNMAIGGDTTFGNNISVPGTIIGGNEIQIRDDAANDKDCGINFYNHEGTVNYGKVSIIPNGDMYLWAAGKRIYTTDPIYTTSTITSLNDGSFSGNLWAGNLLTAGNLTVEGTSFTRNIAIRDDASDNRDNTLAFVNNANTYTYASIASTAAGDLQFWSNGGWCRSAVSFVAPLLQSDGKAIIQDELWANSIVTNSFHNWGATILEGATTLNSDVNMHGNLNIYYKSAGAVAIELGLGAGGDITSLIDFHASAGDDFGARIQRYAGVDGNFNFINAGSGATVFTNNGTGNIAFNIDGAPKVEFNYLGDIWTYGNSAYINQRLLLKHDGAAGHGYVIAMVNSLYLGAGGNYGVMIGPAGDTNVQHGLSVAGTLWANSGVYAQAADGIAVNITDSAGDGASSKIRFTNNAVSVSYGWMGFNGGQLAMNNVRPGGIIQFYNEDRLSLSIENAGPLRVGNDPWNNYAQGYIRCQVYGGCGIGTDSIGGGDYTAGSWLWNHSEVGAIRCTGVGSTYATVSDSALKENIKDAPDVGELFDRIKVRQFDWKGHDVHQRYGTVAQELLEVFPEAISQTAANDEREAGPLMVDYSTMVPLLIKEIQGLRSRVAYLEGYGERK